jgi:hypothetical protein
MDPHLVSARHALAGRVTFYCAAICCALAVPKESPAQIVTPKTLPVLQGGQFDMLPSDRAGMGGVSIAVDDTLLDPYVNPAKATRLAVRHFVSTPFFHSISGSRGGGRSLPVGGGGTWGNWSATGLLTYQQLDRVPPTPIFFVGCPVCADSGFQSQSSTSGSSAYNQYLAGSVAKRVSPSMSIGFGLQLAAIEAIDGVDLLYSGSDRIEQSGSLADFRLGLTKETAHDGQFELMLVHARSNMKHDVHFSLWRWDPVTHQTVFSERSDNNQDQSRIWGVHSEFSRPIGTEGWRAGWLGTVNRISHPKIPNYTVQNIPRDPGTTYSFNLGAGIGRTINRTSFGADFIFEPIVSNTWATAAKDTSFCGGDVCNAVIRAGERTVDNNFHFRNVKVRLGAGQETTPRAEGGTSFGYQVGLDLYSIDYRLHQNDHLREANRTQHENWLEWTPTLGLRLHSRPLDVRYNFSLTCGPGSCDGTTVQSLSAPVADAATGIIAAPSGQLFMQSGSLKIHKLTILVPIH